MFSRETVLSSGHADLFSSSFTILACHFCILFYVERPVGPAPLLWGKMPVSLHRCPSPLAAENTRTSSTLQRQSACRQLSPIPSPFRGESPRALRESSPGAVCPSQAVPLSHLFLPSKSSRPGVPQARRGLQNPCLPSSSKAQSPSHTPRPAPTGLTSSASGTLSQGLGGTQVE